MKQCSKCGENKFLDDFPSRGNQCKDCRSLYYAERWQNLTEDQKEKGRIAVRDHYSRNREQQMARIEETRIRRRDILAEIKREKGCMDCGYNDPRALEFDHRPGEEKVFELSIAHKYSAEKVEAELAKCDVVCANCHRIRTAERRLK